MKQIQQLSLRLQTIAREVPKESRLADIGTDHAQLPVALMADGRLRFAVASDAKAGPFQTALRRVEAAGFSDSISVRHGEGLQALEVSDCIDVLVIAGMGGRLITDILSKGANKLESVQRLILQPNVAADMVREWLYDNEWTLMTEQIVQEEQFYEVLIAAKEDGEGYRDAYANKNWDDAILFGPKLLEKKPEVFRLKWEQDLDHLERVLQQMNTSIERTDIGQERARIKNRIDRIREVIK
ncbi:tRNA (adenine(22)-N(1))-methyltransferase TrmK [Salicibibacter cibarius]|uniref:tRNA (Adenine(22)-N(1))-methyltransferase TrmK n=1 Tax=Salicibibacter cibarius TaxID=2743000 RepID=A0A7T7CBC7_9BACI|nr:tRNA (adenine(22)-N(1))-methyltransferase TrmK [Salicibibacter cibarius]QQK75839.1 tRNA (adenine(22)-N(1))-methyltransferase TrmK [Salicibibacter cibarius]